MARTKLFPQQLIIPLTALQSGGLTRTHSQGFYKLAEDALIGRNSKDVICIQGKHLFSLDLPL